MSPKSRGPSWPLSAFAVIVTLVLTNVLAVSLWLLDARLGAGPYDPSVAGDVASWFSGTAGLLAVLGAIYFFRRELSTALRGVDEAERQANAAMEQVQLQRELEQRVYASRVSGWLDYSSISGLQPDLRTTWDAVICQAWQDRLDDRFLEPGPEMRISDALKNIGASLPGDAGALILHLQNTCGEPIYALHATVVRTFGGETTEIFTTKRAVWPPTTPHLAIRLLVDDFPLVVPFGTEEEWCNQARIVLHFEDIQGLKWRRGISGRLELWSPTPFDRE